MKKNSLVAAVIIGFYAPCILAADAENSTLQQQLQSIQQTMDQPSPSPAAQQTTAPVLAPAATGQAQGTSSNDQGNIPANANPNASPFEQLPPPPVPTATSGSASGPAGGSTNQNAPAVAVSSESLRDEAFARVTNSALPLTPTQIQLLRSLYDATQRAAAVFPGVPPRPTSNSIAVNLSPGATPPVIRLGAGFVTSLVFVDSTGSPWPIESYSLGNPAAFNIQWDKKSNILLVQAIAAHRIGNLAVILRGLNTPVMIDLSPGQAAMDVRVDLRIPSLGPEAKPSFTQLPAVENPFLLNLLDGIPPPGAKQLKASDCEDCAWLLDGKLYLRTQYTVLSPGWISSLSSADGTHVYEMQPTPMILVTYNGKTIKLKIEGF
ncbi:MAG TPA: DotH/IcmK family type IV secretion protein [Gammaproteobacteria bacterium]|nr:DotH/IcmK family type IV secretion protein [Gammaproteobacteria bacterium]